MRKSGEAHRLPPCFLARVRKRLKEGRWRIIRLGKSEKECVSARKQRGGNSRFFSGNGKRVRKRKKKKELFRVEEALTEKERLKIGGAKTLQKEPNAARTRLNFDFTTDCKHECVPMSVDN
jgi:hypothetical protein